MNPITKQSHVYLLQSGDSNEIKIGFSSQIGRRLRALQTGQPKRLKVLAMVNGDRTVESLLHRIFADFRIPDAGTEWFELPWETIYSIQRPVKRLDRPSDMYVLPDVGTSDNKESLALSPKVGQMISASNMRLLPEMRESDEVTEWVVSESSEDNKLVLISKDGSMKREVERKQEPTRIVETVFETYLLESDGENQWQYRQPVEVRYLPLPTESKPQLPEAPTQSTEPVLETTSLEVSETWWLLAYTKPLLSAFGVLVAIGFLSPLFLRPGSAPEKVVITSTASAVPTKAISKPTPQATPVSTPIPTPTLIPITTLEKQMQAAEKKWMGLFNLSNQLSQKESQLESQLEEVKSRLKEAERDQRLAWDKYQDLEKAVTERKEK